MTKSEVKKFDWNLYPAIPDIMENTDFKTYEKAVAAVQTLAWLEDGAPHKFDGLPGVYRFDMETFINDKSEYVDDRNMPNSCGTSCCIAGAMTSYMGFKNTLKDDYSGRSIKPNQAWLDSVFGFDEHDGSELDRLFYPRKRDSNILKVSVPVAARTFRRYLETGKTNWRA